MIGYKSNGDDGYIVVEVEVDSEGNPIIPSGVILTPPPTPEPGHNLTISDGDWVQVEQPIYIPPETIEDVRYTKQLQLDQWKQGFMSQPFIYEGYVFSNDLESRENLNSAIRAIKDWNIVPSLWMSANNEVIDNPSIEFMTGLSKESYIEQERTRTIVFRLQSNIKKFDEIEALRKITFPKYDSVDALAREIDKK